MSSHNFTVGTPQNRKQTPLTIDQIAKVAPSALAVRPYAEMSTKYAYIPTINIIEGMMKAGFQPFSAIQSRCRIADKAEFTKHMIRFRHADMGSLVVGDTVPEIVLVNSHDGACCFKLMAGMYRLVCSNGLLVAEAEIASISIRHTGDILGDVVHGSEQLIGDAQKTLGTVNKWGQLLLTDGEQHALASAAHTLRFADSEGKITTPITPDQLLAPRRYEDQGNDLWRTWNRVQENVLKGGISAVRRNENGERVRRVSTKAIQGINGQTNLNRALWQLGQKMAELKAGPKVIDAEMVEAA